MCFELGKAQATKKTKKEQVHFSVAWHIFQRLAQKCLQ